MELELRQFQDFKVIPNSDGKSIQLSGTSLESAWPVKEQKKRSGSVNQVCPRWVQYINDQKNFGRGA